MATIGSGRASLIATKGGGASLYAFTNFTFTSAGVSGYVGPSLAQCQSAYAGAVFLSSYFTTSNGTQLWTAPVTGLYQIELLGASGGGNTNGASSYFPADPGAGAVIITNVTLTSGVQYSLVIGQKPTGTGAANGSAGGGGSFIYTGTIGGGGLIAAAGGGGGWGHGTSGTTGGNGLGGSSSNSATRCTAGTSINGKTGSGTGQDQGIGYGGGLATTGAYGGSAGGAGWLSDGINRTAGSTATGGTRWNGGTSTSGASVYGGFGGGGGANGNGIAGGGGGGYTGGAAANDWDNTRWGNAGGGGSYWTGTLVSSTAGADGGSGGHLASNSINGYIKITKL